MSRLTRGIYMDQTTGNGQPIEIDFGKLAVATLEALLADPGITAEWKADAQEELDSRGDAKSTDGGELVAEAERRAAAAKKTPGVAVHASHSVSKNPLIRNAEKRAAAGTMGSGGDVIGSGRRS
jgi:hypothetical protein